MVKNVLPLGAMVGAGYITAAALACCIPFVPTIVVGAAAGVIAAGVTCKTVGLLLRGITRARPVNLQQQVHQQITRNLAIAEAFEGTHSPVKPTWRVAKRPGIAKPSAQNNALQNDQAVKVVNSVNLHLSHNRQQLPAILTTPPASDRCATPGKQTGVAKREPMSPDDLIHKAAHRREAAFRASLHNHLSWDNSPFCSAQIPDIPNVRKQSDLSPPGASGAAREPMEVDHEKFLSKANEFLKQMGKSIQEHREWRMSLGKKTVHQQSSESNL